ncbi:uncharacterized protein LY89DRAFT_786330 [Mollisia scopiformis]|uniref:Uncharacterized protein n=1 Tax=Mollisia scopiformis TaxID=149040 RepID=A0A194WWZ9_MOLSC|nr:uncharacterized protein LY89DRAFT_786330 [Mollisia scopiformis]KUJ12209.1 hypothetical protein LY89DRAFT_786330 [Mollisia scopiformis]
MIQLLLRVATLTDADRWDWLTRLRDKSLQQLKRKYRDVIRVAPYYDHDVRGYKKRSLCRRSWRQNFISLYSRKATTSKSILYVGACLSGERSPTETAVIGCSAQ